MTVLHEGELAFSFPASSKPHRFDGSNHGLSHCMKAVDFVVEFANFYLFVEVKDPDNTNATLPKKSKFANGLQLPVFSRDLARKYRDSFVYHWAENKQNKPIKYVVLLALSTLQAPEYLALQETLKTQLPLSKTPKTWTRPIVNGLAVLSIAQWNLLGVYGTVQRV